MEKKQSTNIQQVVVCSSACQRMDHKAVYTEYKLLSQTITLPPQPPFSSTTTGSNNLLPPHPTWPRRTNIVCWHCCHTFDTVPISIPKTITTHHTNKRLFHVFGVFCSINCAKKFISETTAFDQQTILMQLHELCIHVFCIPVGSVFACNDAPPRYFLKLFGGHLDIEAFRKTSVVARSVLITPPMVSHTMILEAHQTTRQATTATDTTAATMDADSRQQQQRETCNGSADMQIEKEGRDDDRAVGNNTIYVTQHNMSHKLRGLRRPSKPVTPPPVTKPAGAVSRYTEFVAHQTPPRTEPESAVQPTTPGQSHPQPTTTIPTPTQHRRKKSRESSEVNASYNLTNFLMSPPAQRP